LCSKDAKSVYHLFVTCIFFQDVWTRIKKEIKFLNVWEGSTIYGFFENWDGKEAIFITLPSMLY